ncbi:hypothetical protein H0H87_005490 [Tephrocybe sp. NHM501043]|nr:hypothetical protein H0H87_005490 [Tephrocybe sp. NHM501043]
MPYGHALLDRARDWCRPRHYLTAAFVVMLLLDKLNHPHDVLDRYINGLTGYDDLDSKEYIDEEGLCTVEPFFDRLGRLVEGQSLLQSTAHEVIMDYIITGQHSPCFGINKVDIVTSAVGEFKDTNIEDIARSARANYRYDPGWLLADDFQSTEGIYRTLQNAPAVARQELLQRSMLGIPEVEHLGGGRLC